MTATITDVAKESGVSIATVSTVLNNGSKPVRAETRQRVLGAARRLNYHPNAMAQAMVRRRLYTLGVYYGVVASSQVVSHPYAAGLLEGVLTAATDAGYNVTLYTAPWRSAPESAAAFRDGRADGLLLIAPPTDSDILRGLAAGGMPLVTIAAPAEDYGVPSVDVDDARGIRAAVAHLRGLGHRRIAHLTGNENMASAHVRRAAFVDALTAAGHAPPPEFVQTCSYDGGGGYEATRRLLALPEPPTAVVAGNDYLALAAVQAARDAGVSVPTGLSVVGYDDVPQAALVRPALTTLRQPLPEIGARAARLLIARIEGTPLEPTPVRVAPELVVRETTGPPAA